MQSFEIPGLNLTVNTGDVLVWLIVGALVGSFVGMIVARKKEGFGRFWNLLVGLIGAALGGFLFEVLPIPPLGLGELTVTGEDLVAALIGAVLFLFLLWLLRFLLRRRKKEDK